MMTAPLDWSTRQWAAPLSDPEYRLDVWSRIKRHVTVSERGCWVWSRHVDAHGYGRVSVKRQMKSAHQVSLAIHLGGLWPRRLQVDHLCYNRACCNPDHLELVTPAENTRRGYAPNIAGWIARSKTHCKSGHLFDLANTYIHPVTGHRACRACRAACERKRKERASAVSI